MAEIRDLALLFGAVLFLSGTAVATGIVNVSDITGIIPANGGGGDTQEPTYSLTTEVKLQASAGGILIDESSFNYDTQKCSLLTCNNLAFSDLSSLAIGGADQVELTTTVYTPEGQKFAQVNKFYGEVGAFQSETSKLTFDPLPPGTYTVKYHLTAQGDPLSQPIDQTLSKEVRVPETISQR